MNWHSAAAITQSATSRAPRGRTVRRRRGAPWSVAELKQLGKRPDSTLARRMGRTIKEVVAMRESRRIKLPTPPRRWTAREIRLLGTMNDAELGRRLRRHYYVVRKKRNAFKIPSFLPHSAHYTWTKPAIGLLGRFPDPEVARRLGIPDHVVLLKRTTLKIPPFKLRALNRTLRD